MLVMLREVDTALSKYFLAIGKISSENGLIALLVFLLLVISSIFGIWSYFHQSRYSHYGELDRIYLDLLKLRVEAPDIAFPPVAGSRSKLELEQLQKAYDQHAYLVWTVLETIYDRCEQFPELMKTWQPIIRLEGRTHIDYFRRQVENGDGFQIEFIDFIRRGGLSGYNEKPEEKKKNLEFAEFARRVLGPAVHAARPWWRHRRLTLAILVVLGLSVAIGIVALNNRYASEGPVVRQSQTK